MPLDLIQNRSIFGSFLNFPGNLTATDIRVLSIQWRTASAKTQLVRKKKEIETPIKKWSSSMEHWYSHKFLHVCLYMGWKIFLTFLSYLDQNKWNKIKHCGFKTRRKRKPGSCLEPVGTDMIVLTTASFLILDICWTNGKQEWEVIISINNFVFLIDFTNSSTVLYDRTKASE